MKIFLLTSFSGEVDEHGNVKAPFRQSVESFLTQLRDAGHQVTSAIETDGWKLGDQTAEGGTKTDLAEIRASDAIVALHVETSAGMQFELGYATALGKRVILVLGTDSKPGWFLTGAINLGLIATTPPDDVLTALD